MELPVWYFALPCSLDGTRPQLVVEIGDGIASLSQTTKGSFSTAGVMPSGRPTKEARMETSGKWILNPKIIPG
jgi:hypothetical protein